MDLGGQGLVMDDLNLWPIQASFPDPVRWKAWRKQLRGALYGMPLWNTEDLVKGYVFSLFSLSAPNPEHARV